ncbi:hypothetical protein MBLNU457_5552t1 [Dothideomycetes sp. NU457]
MRSIQDSEDEDEELSPLKPRHQAAIPTPEVANSLDRSTDSTDTQLRKAHLALIEPTPTFNMIVSESPAETRKRRSTATDAPSSSKKTKTTKAVRSQSTQASQQSFNSAGVQDAIHHAYVLQPTGDTERMGTVEQEQALEEALVTKTLHIEPESVSAAQDEHGNQSSPMPWSAGPSEIRTQSTEQFAQVPRSTGPNSDDLIGLPREQYQARASRSRSTQIADIHIDWSAVPERVAKKKRRKTADAQPNPSSSVDPLLTASPELRKSQTPRSNKTAVTETESGSSAAEHVTAAEATLSVTEESHRSEIAETPQEPDISADQQVDSASQASHHSLVEVRSPVRSSESTTRDKPLLEMPPPSMPPPSMPPPSMVDAPSKRGRKSKRSHTTIFEDHIGLEPVLPSQNLKQQQAARKTEATGKKGRGRPKKVDAEKIQEPAMVVEETPPEPAPLENSPAKEAETPKPASQSLAHATPPTPESSPLRSSSPSSGRTAREAIGTGKESDVTPTADITLSAPSLKKSVNMSSEPHSPIKTGKNVFRVGLSKRQRIKPLLKIVGR